MLNHPTLDKLHTLRLTGMAEALALHLQQPRSEELAFEERLAILVDHEVLYRENRRLTRLLREAKLRVQACVEDIDYRHERGLKRAEMASLVASDWAIGPLNASQRGDLMEIIEERHGRQATLIASQLPIDHWHDYIGEATLADAILDRLLHNAHRLPLTGESMRKSD